MFSGNDFAFLFFYAFSVWRSVNIHELKTNEGARLAVSYEQKQPFLILCFSICSMFEIFSRMHATLKPASSVRPSVHPSISPSVRHLAQTDGFKVESTDGMKIESTDGLKILIDGQSDQVNQSVNECSYL